jgi:hypothetical protein
MPDRKLHAGSERLTTTQDNLTTKAVQSMDGLFLWLEAFAVA